MQQVTRGTSNTISATFFDGENLAAVTSATLGVVASDGTVIVAPGTSATEPATGSDSWTYVLPPVADCERLTATWAGVDADSNVWSVIQPIDVVGGFYFDLNDLKAMPDIAGDDTYNGQYIKARQWIETLIERVISASFVERFFEETHHNRRRIFLRETYPVRILSVSVDGTAVSTTPMFLDNEILITREMGWPLRWSRATIRYVAGYTTEPPEDLRIAALQAARNRLLSVDGASGIPERALSMTNAFGNIRMATAGSDAPTGYPEVDAVICGWRDKISISGIA